jgi:hypothetical protein
MEQKIEELKKRFISATSESEIAEIDKEMDELSKSDQSGFENAMMSAIQDTNKRVESEILRDKLESVLPAISVSHLAKEYFGKTPQWFYQRLNGNTVNGKQAKFTNNELHVLADALKDISKRISQSVAFVV